MSELQHYYDSFRSAYWADHDRALCGCRGTGWALSQVDTWHQCPIHGKGVPHPDEVEMEGDDATDVGPAPVVVRPPLPAEDDDHIPF